MTHTTIPGFTQAAQQAQHWVNELASDLDWSAQRAYRLLRAVLHTLRDWLSPEEAADLSAQFPVLVRGIFFEGWHPSLDPIRERSKQDFVEAVARGFDDGADVDIEDAIGAVFNLLDRHISYGEIVQVRNLMKKSLRELWPAD